MPPAHFSRNPGIPLDLSMVEAVQVNKAAVDRRAATHLARRSIKKKWQLAWLCRVVTLIDLTTLAGDDTASNVKRLCFKARNPIRSDIVEKLGLKDKNITVGAVCVYPNRVKEAKQFLKDTKILIASVAAGFPAGQTPMTQRLAEIKQAVEDGASEIDIVISRDHVITHNWEKLYAEVKAMREACGSAKLKTILAVGDLPSYRDIYKSSLVCMMAGADTIKTSTGKETINATMANSIVMVRAIREYYQKTGFKVGFKPAGGIRSAKDAMLFLSMMMEELGPDWTYSNLFRIGASSLLVDVERQLYHGVTGHYAGKHYLAMS